MNTIDLTVEKSTITKNGNYANKLIGKGADIPTDFGTVEGPKKTFYLFTQEENEEGKKAKLNLDLFDIVQREFPFKDETGVEQVATLSYIYPKRLGDK